MDDATKEKSPPRCQPGTGVVKPNHAEVIISGPHGKLPFIPAWLDDARLSQAEFRIYCHLCRRADNQSGIAWPSYQAIQDACGLSRKTVWRTMKDLEHRGMIEKAGKPFGGSCRYRILAAIVPHGEPLQCTNGATTGTIDDPQSFPTGNSNRSPHDASIVSSGEREGSPLKVPQRKVPQNEDTPVLPNPPEALKLQFEESTRDTAAMAEAIYQRYPRKEGKSDALKAITKAMKRHDPKFLLERTETYAAAIAWKERQFIPHPATWFNGERFNDDPEAWKEPATTGRNGKAEHRNGEYPEPPITKLPRL